MSFTPISLRGPARLLASAALAGALAFAPGVALAADGAAADMDLAALADEAEPIAEDDSALVAQADVETSGICGTCTWAIDDSGILVIKPADGVSGTLERSQGASEYTPFPWTGHPYAYFDFFDAYTALNLVKGLRIESGVRACADMSYAFAGLQMTTAFDVSGLDTSDTTNMSHMFAVASFPSRTDLRVLDVSHVTNMDGMFSGATFGGRVHDASLTSAATSMKEAWFETNFLWYRDTSSDTSNVTDMSYVFANNIYLEHLNIPAYNNRNAVTTDAFKGVKNLKDITVGANWDTGKDGAWPTESADRWWSYKEQRWFTNEEITTSRRYTADTYTTTEGAPEEGPWRRLAGPNRYDTMAAVVERGFSSSDYAVVATGSNFPDALAASSLAGAFGCPVILTDGGSLSPQAEAQLKRLGVSGAYLVGGEAALSAAVEGQIGALGIATARLSGATRQETALKVMAAVRENGWHCDAVVVATGEKFADSLSIGPWAYAQNAPIVLTDSDGRLSDEAVAAIRASGATRAVLVGGEAVVSADVEAQLSGLEVVRLGGATRYETSADVARWAADNGQSLWSVAVATGERYPDALAASALMGGENGVILLASGDGTAAAGLLSERKADVIETFVLGGDAAVAPSLAEALAATAR